MSELIAHQTATLVAVDALGPGLYRIDFEGRNIGKGVVPGRFAMVEAPGRTDCLLKRPFSYFLAPDNDHISLLVKDVGKGTHGLCVAKPGDSVDLMGPLGNGFPKPQGNVWVVCGGVGAGPFGGMAQHRGVNILLGARNTMETGFADALRAVGGQVEVATDDGSYGHKGSVVDLMRMRLLKIKADKTNGGHQSNMTLPNTIMTCGPTQMMDAVTQVGHEHGITVWVSLEARMGCGIGICRGCAHVDAAMGWRCICDDGPVYRGHDIFKTKAMP